MVNLTNLNSLMLLSIFGMDSQNETMYAQYDNLNDDNQDYTRPVLDDQSLLRSDIQDNILESSDSQIARRKAGQTLNINLNVGEGQEKAAKPKKEKKPIIGAVGKLLCFVSSDKEKVFDIQEPKVADGVLNSLDTLDLEKLYNKEESKKTYQKARQWDREEKSIKKFNVMKDTVRSKVLQILRNNTDMSLSNSIEEREELRLENIEILRQLGNPRFVKGIRYILPGKNILSGFYPLYNKDKMGSSNIETKYNFLISGKHLTQKINLFLFRDVMTQEMQKRYALTIEDEQKKAEAMAQKKGNQKLNAKFMSEHPYTLQQCLNGILLSRISKFIIDIRKSRVLYINVEKDHYYDSQRERLFLGKTLCVGQNLYKEANNSSEFIQLDYDTSKQMVTAKLNLMFGLIDLQRRSTVQNLDKDLNFEEKTMITQTLKIIDNDIDMIIRHFVDPEAIALFADHKSQEESDVWQKQKLMLIDKQEVIRNFLNHNKNLKKAKKIALLDQQQDNFKVQFNKLVDNLRGSHQENWFQKEMERIVQESKAYQHENRKRTQEMNQLEYNLEQSKNNEDNKALSDVVASLFGGGIVGAIGASLEDQLNDKNIDDATKAAIAEAVAEGKTVIREETIVTNPDGTKTSTVKITESGKDLSNEAGEITVQED